MKTKSLFKVTPCLLKKTSKTGGSRIKLAVAAASFVALFGTASVASAVLIDFESFAVNTNIENVDLGGVALSIAGGVDVEISSSVPGPTLGGTRTFGGTTFIHSNPFLGQFLGSVAGTVNFVSIALGDFNGDADNIFLRVFDVANTQIGSASDSLPASLNGGRTLSVSVAGIDHFEFGSTGTFANSVFGDNLEYRVDAATVHEPGMILLLGSGLVGLFAYRMKKKIA